MITIKKHISNEITKAIVKLIDEGFLPEEVKNQKPVLSPPKFKEHGDLATNFALTFAKKAKKSPREVAEKLVAILSEATGVFKSVEVAGPGFINFRIADSALYEGLLRIITSKGDWGKGEEKDISINLEFVSANPTGPMHVGHGRGAAVGDALARILKFNGYKVTSEYYLNDAGRQVDTLAKSIWARYLDLCRAEDNDIPEFSFPEDGYQGDYVIDMAKRYLEINGTTNAKKPFDIEKIKEFGISQAVETIKSTLGEMDVKFDLFYSEKELHRKGALQKAQDYLKERGELYEKDGAIFFQSTKYGDEKDRVVIRANGDPTYFAADIAYHLDKFNRGFDTLIDIWGADHHGYVPRVKAAIESFGKSPEKFEALLVQFVSLVSGDEKLAMGKRSGNFVTLTDLMNQVGADVTRWFFLAKSHDSALDFDLSKAVSADPRENPARYAQYGHARACSILAKSKSIGFSTPEYSIDTIKHLNQPEELDLVKDLLKFPEVVSESARLRSPNKIANYLVDISRSFHSYYTKYKNDSILPKQSDLQEGWQKAWDMEKTNARLIWVNAFKIVSNNALTILGLPAPQRMNSLVENTTEREDV